MLTILKIMKNYDDLLSPIKIEEKIVRDLLIPEPLRKPKRLKSRTELNYRLVGLKIWSNRKSSAEFWIIAMKGLEQVL